MVDSKMVLTGQTLAYTFYCIVIILLVVWFSIKVTGKGKGLACKTGNFLHFCRISDCTWCFSSPNHLQHHSMGRDGSEQVGL